MFGVGINLQLEDFRRIIVKPQEITVSMIGQMILLPLIAFLIALLLDFPTWAKIGLVLVSVSPSGASPNFITYYLDGRLALAVSTTALSSVLSLIAIPLIVSLALQIFESKGQQISLPFWETILKICITVIIPISLGVLLRENKEEIAIKLEKIMKWGMPVILLIIFGGSIFLESGGSSLDIMKYLNQYPYAIALNVGAVLASYLLARLVLKDKKAHYTISTVVGIQSNALAIFVANTILNRPDLAIMPIIYSSFTFFSTALFALAVKKLE